MKCPNCGHEVREGQAFCTNCGSPLPKTNTPGEGPTRQGHGTARPNICPRCGRTLPEGCEFCPNCGTRVAGSAEPVTPPAPAAPPVDPSRTQAMPVMPQNPPRVEAVPSPPQEGYSTSGGSERQTGTDTSKVLLIVAGVIVAIAVAAVAVMAVLGVGPFQHSAAPTDNQNVAEVTNGSVAVNDNQNGNASDSSSSTANNSASANGNTASNANANQNTSSANTNANASGNANASDASNSASANANAGDDEGTSGSVSLSGGYVSNSNSAYGYSLRVPTSFTLSGSDSVGNATLTDTASPCVITVSVDDNPNGYTVDQALANASAGATSNAYTAEGNGWYVYSDEPNGSVFYVMSYVQQGRTISLRFSYPSSAKSQCDPIIESVQPTFSVN